MVLNLSSRKKQPIPSVGAKVPARFLKICLRSCLLQLDPSSEPSKKPLIENLGTARVNRLTKRPRQKYLGKASSAHMHVKMPVKSKDVAVQAFG